MIYPPPSKLMWVDDKDTRSRGAECDMNVSKMPNVSCSLSSSIYGSGVGSTGLETGTKPWLASVKKGERGVLLCSPHPIDWKKACVGSLPRCAARR